MNNFEQITTEEKVFELYPVKMDPAKIKETIYATLPPELASGAWEVVFNQMASYVINNDDPAVPEWKADYNDEDQEKWFPWYYGGSADGTGSGFRFLVSDIDWTLTFAGGGARFALKSKSRADHMNKYFQPRRKAFYLILKQD